MGEMQVFGIDENITQSIKEEERVIAFMLNDELIGINIKNVTKITKKLDISPVPKTPEYIVGVMNLRGNIVPVVNLKKMLNLPNSDIIDQEYILIIDTEIGNIGLLIDKVVGAITIENEEILPAPINSIGIDAKYVIGVIIIDQEKEQSKRNLLILLDTDKLFNKKEIQENQE
ncbi:MULTISPECIES: chemotaxis protein CheW [unclassified Nitratiruptor]|uniref:chemotaxis protein CheW n=1 Tax=unclassified Nitratiruptor TaxID=2624044 RepID=UPI0019155B47|nr:MULTISPECIES: chemotaxis protein CheW [unclassified Nitratiruptor]BCD59903.1 purine-binding chemotaxis protein CheW [Nitratiruptor sp. YY08-10]BCD63826.1 purine-binding chemotaxis protein CheW [Nitratiruptor sp. YY08-14]